eukprot:3081839-Amphidinium_carterae.1
MEVVWFKMMFRPLVCAPGAGGDMGLYTGNGARSIFLSLKCQQQSWFEQYYPTTTLCQELSLTWGLMVASQSFHLVSMYNTSNPRAYIPCYGRTARA